MKRKIINHWMNIIKKYKNPNDNELVKIEYGLTGLYLTLSKLIIISIISIILGIFKEMIIFISMYNLLRMPSFGIHATKSWICLLSSTIIFIGLPILCLNIKIILPIKLLLGIICVILMLKNSPADTKKRPIVNSKRRLIYKSISTIISIIYVILSIIVKNNFLSNCMMFSLILQNVLISPLTYKLFKQPYNNYKEFLKTNPNFLNSYKC